MSLEKGHDFVCIERETLGVGAKKANDKRSFGQLLVVIGFNGLNEFRLNFSQ